MPDKLSVQDFAKRIKNKYPEYQDMDDYVLAEKIVKKFPEYESEVDFQVKKKDLSSQDSQTHGKPFDGSGTKNDSEEKGFFIDVARKVAETPVLSSIAPGIAAVGNASLKSDEKVMTKLNDVKQTIRDNYDIIIALDPDEARKSLRNQVVSKTENPYIADEAVKYLDSLDEKRRILASEEKNMEPEVETEFDSVLENIKQFNTNKINENAKPQEGPTNDRAKYEELVGVKDKAYRDYSNYLKEINPDEYKKYTEGDFEKGKKGVNFHMEALTHQKKLLDAKYQEGLIDKDTYGIEIDRLARSNEEALRFFPDYKSEVKVRADKQKQIDEIYKKAELNINSSDLIERAKARSIVGYYNVVAPAAANLTKFGADIISSTGRLSSLGKSDAESEAINGLVDDFSDYFDTEKASSPYKLPSDLKGPLYEDGKLNTKVLIPKVSETLTQMYTLVLGGGGASKTLQAAGMSSKFAGKAGLFTSSFLSTQNQFYMDAKADKNISNDEAMAYSLTAATTQAMLEWVSPQKYITGNITSGKASRDAVIDIASGVSRNKAIMKNFVFGTKEAGKEVVEEFSEEGGTLLNNYVFNQLTDSDLKTSMGSDEMLELVTLTAIVGGIGSTSGFKGSDQLRAEAFRRAMQNQPDFEKSALKEENIENLGDERIAKAKEQVKEYTKIYNSLPDSYNEAQKTKLAMNQLDLKELEARKREEESLDPIISEKAVLKTEEEIAKTREEMINNSSDKPKKSKLFNEPNPETADIAKKYKEEKGIDIPEGENITKVDPDRATKIADEYEKMEDSSDDPETQEAYNALADETASQHQTIVDSGYTVEIWEGEGEPYASSEEMIKDLKENKHMYIFGTESGFGDSKITETDRKKNKMLQDSGMKDTNGKPLLYNDIFRFVHDFFGHSERGNSFGPIGEENAWDVHARMYSDKARRAMTTETRGQNSWVNFGPQMRGKDGKLLKKGDEGYLSPQDRAFAEQKMGLLPEWVSDIDTKKEAKSIKPQNTSDVDKLIESAKTEEGKKALSTVKNVVKALKGVDENVEIVIHEDSDSYSKAIQEAGGTKEDASSSGFYDNGSQIHINVAEAQSNTAFHEGGHKIIDSYVKRNPEVLPKWEQQLRESLPKEAVASLDEFTEGYDEDSKSDEFVTEALARIADGQIEFEKSALDKIKDFIRTVAKTVGLDPDSIKLDSNEDIKDFARKVSEAFKEGKEISLNDTEAINEGSSAPLVETTIKKQKGRDKVVVNKEGHNLSFVSEEDLIDIDALVEDIVSKDQKVWFWVADQLGRGEYSDNVVNGEHYLDAGPSYALDPKNRDKNIIWATGKNETDINRLIDSSDYIFIISGGPQKSKLFNSTVISLVEKRVGDFSKFKDSALENNAIKPLRESLEKHDSWESLKSSPDRKTFMLALEDVKKKKSTPLKSFLEESNAFIELDELRDGFYRDNDFEMNDVMLVLKPESFGGKSKHSTYENDIIGEVVGVPNKKLDAYSLMPEEVRKAQEERYEKANIKREKKGQKPITPGRNQQSQVVAPYGIGVKSISDEYLKANGIEKGMTTTPVERNIKLQKKAKKGDDLVKDFGKTGKFDVHKRMTEDGEGNYLFFHYSGNDFKGTKIDPKYFGKNNYTSDKRMHKVSFYYTQANEREGMVGAQDVEVKVVAIPKDKVYPLQSDPLNFSEEAEKRFREDFDSETLAFDPWWEASYIGQVAKDNGFEMLVSVWGGLGKKALRGESQNKQSFTKGMPKLQKKPKGKDVQKAVDKETGVKKPVKWVKMTERTALKEKIKTLSRGYREGAKIAKDALETAKKEFLDIVNSELEGYNITPADQKTIRTMVRDVNASNMEGLLDRIDGLIEKAQAKDARLTKKAIQKLVNNKKTILRKVGRKWKGKVPISVQDYLASFDLNSLDNMSREELKATLNQLEELVDAGKKEVKLNERLVKAERNRYAGKIFEALRATNKDGKQTVVNTKEEVISKLEEGNKTAILDGQPISSKSALAEFMKDNDVDFTGTVIYNTPDVSVAKINETSLSRVMRGWINPITAKNNLWNSMLPLIYKSKAMRNIITELKNDIDNADFHLGENVSEKIKNYEANLKKIFKYSFKGKRILGTTAGINIFEDLKEAPSNSIMVNLYNVGRSGNQDVAKDKNGILMTDGYMKLRKSGLNESQQKELDSLKRIEESKITPEEKSQIKELENIKEADLVKEDGIKELFDYIESNPQLKEYADYLLNDFYPSMREDYESTYIHVTNTRFPDGVYYPRFAASSHGETIDSGELLDGKGKANYKDAVAGNLKQRVNHNLGLNTSVGAHEVAMNYIQTMERAKHFIPVGEKVNSLFSRINSAEIVNKIGASNFLSLKDHLAVVITGQDPRANKKAEHDKAINAIMAYKIYGALAGKLVSAIKQLTSFTHFSAVEGVRVDEWLRGFAITSSDEFNVVANILKSNYVSTRVKGKSFDIEVNKILDNSSLSRSNRVINISTRVLMSPITVGDIGGVLLGGVPMTIAVYRQEINKGRTHEEAYATAYQKFVTESESAQQSTRASETSHMQRHSVGRLFSAFTTSQTQTTNKLKASIRMLLSRSELSAKEKVEHVYNVAYYSVANVGFAMVTNGMIQQLIKGFDDEEEKQKAIYNTSMDNIQSILNGVGMTGVTVNFIISSLRDDEWKNTIPIVQSLGNISTGSAEIVKALASGKSWDELSDSEKNKMYKILPVDGFIKQINNFLKASDGEKTLTEALFNWASEEEKKGFKPKNDVLYKMLTGDNYVKKGRGGRSTSRKSERKSR